MTFDMYDHVRIPAKDGTTKLLTSIKNKTRVVYYIDENDAEGPMSAMDAYPEPFLLDDCTANQNRKLIAFCPEHLSQHGT